MKELASSVSPEASFFDLLMATFLLCVHMVFLLLVHPGCILYIQIASSCEDNSQIGLGSILRPYYNLKALSLNTE